jgi:RimJ/RimL family protein N-acetyltransferase
MTVLETKRLLLSRFSYDDCEFIHELVNEHSFKRFIGDKNVNSLDDARRYLREGPITMYDKFGYGLFLVNLRGAARAAGICGLVKREAFDDPDIGFAFLERYRGNGYATESATAVLAHGFEVLNLQRIIALADVGNENSVRLLQRLGFVYERKVRMPEDDHDIDLFSIEA